MKENIILPLTLQKLSGTEIQQKYADTLRCVDIGYCENNYPEQSSGGEQQRAAICRAIIKSPKLILADEPTGSLDNVNAKSILSTFMDIKERMQTTIVLSPMMRLWQVIVIRLFLLRTANYVILR